MAKETLPLVCWVTLFLANPIMLNTYHDNVLIEQLFP